MCINFPGANPKHMPPIKAMPRYKGSLHDYVHSRKPKMHQHRQKEPASLGDATIQGFALVAALHLADMGVQTILDRSPLMKWKAGRGCVVISGQAS